LVISLNPPTGTVGSGKTKKSPCVAICGMLQYTGLCPNRSQRSIEASPVIPEFELMRLGCAAMPEPSPSLTWRVRDNGVRTTVFFGIPRFIPWFNVRQPEIAAVSLDEERGDQWITR
jgi:hypothetical protein